MSLDLQKYTIVLDIQSAPNQIGSDVMTFFMDSVYYVSSLPILSIFVC